MNPSDAYFQAREEIKETGLEGIHKTFDRAVDILTASGIYYVDALIQMEDWIEEYA